MSGVIERLLLSIKYGISKIFRYDFKLTEPWAYDIT